MSNYEDNLKELQGVVSKYLGGKDEIPNSLKKLLLFEVEQSVGNLDKEYFVKNDKDKIWEDEVLDRFSWSDINYYLKDDNNNEIVRYLMTTMGIEGWKTCFEKFGTDPTLNEIIECALMPIFSDIFDLLYPIVIKKISKAML
ncbi:MULTISPECIES: hypothetical protein [unclassified Clostridium]|uniref:hypothetical protein n=1 Tax=unclassified Clostridium TaxID=2614128 RepID=UPI0025BDA0EA|nr:MULTISPECIES: hypothetical protein [unclassified Clostridium]